MADDRSGRWVWKLRKDGPFDDNWVEQSRGHSMFGRENVKKKMREMACRHVEGKRGDKTLVYECPESG